MIQTAERTAQDEMTRVRERIVFYEEEVEKHPIAALIRAGTLSKEGQKGLGLYLFSDSWMWPSMLIAMRDRSTHPRLKQAIEDNIRDEAGERGISHITFCLRFLESVGIAPSLQGGQNLDGVIAISTRMSEAKMAGWLIGAEMLTMPLFRLARECFESKEGADLDYLDIHLKVDEDHIHWLQEAVKGLLDNGASVDEILQGVGLGARATLDALDKVFEASISA